MTVSGITDDSIVTAGLVEITIFDKPINITCDLPIPEEGILGVDFMKEESAEISFHHNTIIIGSRPTNPIPF